MKLIQDSNISIMLNFNNKGKNELFKLALGIQDPWQVEKIDFAENEGILNIYLKYTRGSKFLCPVCGKESKVRDTEKRKWKHLNFFQYEAYIHTNLPRVSCDDCKTTKNVMVPWARPESGFTLLFEAFVMELAHMMPMTNVSKITGETDNRLMRIVKYYVTESRKKVDMKNVVAIGTDETSKAKGHKYITTFIDMIEKRVLFATEGKDNTTVKRFADDLEQHNGKSENIEKVCSDLSKAFIKGINENLPNAKIIFDRFHVMNKVSEALDEVRKQEVKINSVLVNSKFAFLHNPETATENQTKKLESLTKLNLKTVRAYQIKLALRDIYEMNNKEQAIKAMKKWYFWATHSRIKPIIKAAKTIKRRWDGVVSFFDDRITNGIAEGYNSIIQTIKRRSRGFRNTDNFITIIYLVLGKLEFNLPRVTNLITP